MVSQNRPGPNDATTSSGIGKNPSPPPIIAPSPRRATTSSILTQGLNNASDSERHNYRHPFPNTPLHFSTPCVLSQQLPLNGIPNAQTGLPPSRGNVSTPHHRHSRNGSGGSGRSTSSPSSKKSTRFSPGVTTVPPEGMHAPPPRDATPTRPAMKLSPARSPQQQLPSQSPDCVPTITIIEATPPSPNAPTPPCWIPRPLAQPPNQGDNAGGNDPDDIDEGATPGQRMLRLRVPSSENHRNRPPSQPVFNDSGYFSPHGPLTERWKAQTLAAQTQNQSQGTGNATPHQNQTGLTSSTNHGQPVSSPQVNQTANQQQRSGSRIHASWQAARPPHACSPVIPSSRSSIDLSHNHTNPTSFPGPSRPTHLVPTPAGPVPRLRNTDVAPINVSFSHPVGGQPSARSHSRTSQRATPFGSARTAFTPANGNMSGDADVNTVVDNLLRVPPSSVAWHTPRGVLTWTSHPALPDSGPGLLGRGSGHGSGGPARNGDWWTGGYPMPGACPTWTPGTWPPVAASTPATPRIQLAPWMIPNPCNAAMPHIMWDISQLPTTAKRITGNYVIVNLMDKLDDVATHPAVDRLVVVCQVGVAERFWGHIDVKASRPKGVTVWDVFNGIYEYFQKRTGRRELDRMKEMLGDERLEEKMADAFYQRLRVTPALPGYERKEGLKRVDALGDTCFFWGMYVTHNHDNTWQLNLGLVNRRRNA